MARQGGYKKLENDVVSSLGRTIFGYLCRFGRVFLQMLSFFDQKLTIMIVPHSQRRVVNFQTNVFALFLALTLLIGVFGSFVYFNKNSVAATAAINKLEKQHEETLASLDEVRDENIALLQAAKRFQGALGTTLARLGINRPSERAAGASSDLSSVFGAPELSAGSVEETADIRELAGFLESSVQPLEQIGKMLEAHGALLSDIPSIWPLSNPVTGHLSMKFGQNIHPITGQLYLHKGLDFSTYRSGDPVVATANGQVVTISWDEGFGLYVVIKHKHGIYTRYAHLNTTRVQKGQFVSQRDVIGTIGNTGISTGPHLHYEVHIGSDVVDPEKYINIKLD
ncbi:MAG: M23 family metallopeptidase [Spirochaetaceae bacterium]|nr:M23 family metallopeptidase [Spirochaetaceae bacterium]